MKYIEFKKNYLDKNKINETIKEVFPEANIYYNTLNNDIYDGVLCFKIPSLMNDKVFKLQIINYAGSTGIRLWIGDAYGNNGSISNGISFSNGGDYRNSMQLNPYNNCSSVFKMYLTENSIIFEMSGTKTEVFGIAKASNEKFYAFCVVGGFIDSDKNVIYHTNIIDLNTLEIGYLIPLGMPIDNGINFNNDENKFELNKIQLFKENGRPIKDGITEEYVYFTNMFATISNVQESILFEGRGFLTKSVTAQERTKWQDRNFFILENSEEN